MKWIKCKDELPATGRRVICCDADGGVFIASYQDYKGIDDDTEPFWLFDTGKDYDFGEPNAWMPMPVPIVQKIKPRELTYCYPNRQYECGNCGSAVTDCVEFCRGGFGTGVKVKRLDACPNCGATVDWSDEV